MRQTVAALLGVTVMSVACAPAALAADLPVKAPVFKAVAPVFDWTGFYLGVYTGVGVQKSRGVDPTGVTQGGLDYTGSGFTGGVTVGYNLQFMPHWVVGIEGDIGYLGLSRNVRDWNDGLNYNSKTSWIGTVRERLGYTDGPNLSYITGGGAFVQTNDSLSNLAGTVVVGPSKTRSGYAYGAGVETMLGGNWTAKAEYLGIAVGKGDAVLIPGSIFNVQTDNRYSLMKFGVNYIFGAKAQGPLPSHNWSGFYAGALGGTSVSQSNGSQPGLAGSIGESGSGFTAGGLVGYNWQFAPQFVVGVEGDFSWFGIDRSQAQYNDFGGGRNAVLGMKTNWLATARARAGYSTGPALLYVTGGGAWVNVRDDWVGGNAGAGTPAVSSTKTLSGYSAGGGIETTLWSNWTSRTEYLYVDVGNGDTLASTASMVVNHKFHVFRSGLTYHIGG